MRTFVIGDIHGEVTKLNHLLDFIKLSKNDLTIFIGDYLDKGENSFLTLERLKSLNSDFKCIFLYGNHEHVWRYPEENIEYLKKYGANTTLQDFAEDNILQLSRKLIKEYSFLFNQNCVFWMNEEFLITHSGLPVHGFEKNLDQIPYVDFLFNRYQFIGLEQKYKGRTIIFGHTGFEQPYFDGFKIGIDTAACYDELQPLTAFCLEEKIFYNSMFQKISINELSLDFCPKIVRLVPKRMRIK